MSKEDFVDIIFGLGLFYLGSEVHKTNQFGGALLGVLGIILLFKRNYKIPRFQIRGFPKIIKEKKDDTIQSGDKKPKSRNRRRG